MIDIANAKRKHAQAENEKRLPHTWDDDGCCTRCGFDGAEFVWWKGTDEGRALPEARMPKCKEKQG